MSRPGQDTGHLPASEAGDGSLEDDLAQPDTGRAASEIDVPSDDEQGDTTQSWPGRDFGSIPPPG